MSKDWKGNTQSVMATLNASNHSEAERAEWDYYATPELAVTELLRVEHFDKAVPIWEPAAGEKAISNILEREGYTVISSDIINRDCGVHEIDFFSCNQKWKGNIITNPPFAKATEFIEHALSLIEDGRKVAFLLRIQFLEGVRRRKLFAENPPIRIWVSTRTLRCAIYGYFVNATGNASTYAWFVWEKGFKGSPSIGWFNDKGII